MNSKPLVIAVVGISSLYNWRLYEAFLLMGQNLEEVHYQMAENYLDRSSPVKYSFSRQPLVLWRNQMAQVLRNFEAALRASDGVVINLGGRVLDLDYLKGDTPPAYFAGQLQRLVTFVQQMKLPMVLALEDIKDSFEPVQLFFDRRETGGGESWSSEFTWPATISVEDDLWDPASPTVEMVRQILQVADTTPLLLYSYYRPLSVQNLLITLLAKIEKAKPGGAHEPG